MSNIELIHGGSALDYKSKIDDDPDWKIDIKEAEELQRKAKEIIKNMAGFENLKKLADVDNVNHPQHYCREDAMECIDEMILIFGKEAVKNFCLCNAWKYRYRAADKNGEEDLRKSDWYIRKYKELNGEDCQLDTITISNNNPQVVYIPQPQAIQPDDYWKTPIYCVNTQYSTTGNIN